MATGVQSVQKSALVDFNHLVIIMVIVTAPLARAPVIQDGVGMLHVLNVPQDGLE